MQIWWNFFSFGLIFSFLYSCFGYYQGNGDIQNEYVRTGNNATLYCQPATDADNINRIVWYKEDKKIVEIVNGRRTLWDAGNHVTLQTHNNALYFRRVTYKDSGEYYCEVNAKRSRSSLARLLVQDIPDPAGMPLIMGFTSRSVNLSWAPSTNNHNSPILHYIIHVRVGELGEWESAMGIMTPDNKTAYHVIGLQPYTVYSFRVVAVNAIGASEPSKESYYMVTLREVPDGKPTITGAFNTSSTSIRLEWAPPPERTIHGEFLGYRITYRPRDRPEEEREIILRDPNLRQYTIRNLDIFTQYLISVQVFNPAGHGPVATVAVMTDEGTPSKPLNLSIQKVGDSSVRLSWQEPEFPNGIIQGYRVYFQHTAQNLTEMRKTQNPQPIMDFVLQNLKPFSHYKIWVNAYTWKYEGETSKVLEFHTDVQGPSAPIILNLTCQALDSIFVQWERPQIFFNRIDYYFVHYRSENNWDFEEIAMASPQERAIDHGMFIPNLTANTMYEVKVRGATRSVIEHSKLFKGQFSEPRKVLLQNKCPTFNGVPYSDSSLSAGMIAGVMCASFALLLAIVSFILWRKYFQAAYYYLDDPLGNRASPQLSETFDDSEYSAVPVHLWTKHVAELHADGDIGFSREYEAIQQATDVDLSSEHSQMMENKNKNRYVNIVAYDHSRVILKQNAGQRKMHDYINANYIDGYNKPAAYIGTQGPLPSTFDDYWRMIWEQRVYIIVMITNLVERGRHEPSTSDWDDTRKCDMYWPKEGTETYGIIQVRLVEELVMATYTVRTFAIKNTKLKKKLMCERNVYQYHYTNWPDHGVPDHALPVLNFVRKSSSANPNNAGPIIVHCSAGVGRTGTYIVLDAMLRQIQHRQSINVCGFLKHIRQQRNYLVQTEEQYIFIHDALLEALESGETEVPLHSFGSYLCNLNNPINESSDKSQTPLEKQFKLATSFKARDFNVVSALKPCNKGKNRSLNLIPLESYRVHITPKPGTDGSDYINATFLPGFHKLREFIITQHPLSSTIPDFWQMVFDHNSQTVVVLSSVDDKEYPCFWPKKGEEADHGGFKVKMVEESCQESFVIRDFILQATQDEYELTCRIFQCPGWPDSCTPPNNVFDLVLVVQNWHVANQYGPIIVIDKFGGTEAASFCCLTALNKQLEYEKCVDVYLHAKLYHMRRPGIWKTQDDLMFLYRALENVVASGSSETESALGNATNGHVNTNGHAVKLPTTCSIESAAA